MDALEKLGNELLAEIDHAHALDKLEQIRVQALGKKGSIQELMKDLGQLDVEARKARGQALNRLKDQVSEALARRKSHLEADLLSAKLRAEAVDVTLTSRPEQRGRIHPVSQVIDEVIEIFADMGFTVAEGPDIEDDFHNFTALNLPPEHPARQMHDTFYFPEKTDGSRMLLRTHTSPVQIRTMESSPPPHRIVIPGRTYRSDSDMTHTPMFHQLELLVIDKGIHMGHLKGTLEAFVSAFFEVDDVPIRLRPSHFPFTEPSAECDIGCSRKGGELKIGAGEGWLEILGCGMVHPNVLTACGLDPQEWQGFAAGLGIDRLAMLKYGIPDLRAFFDSDLRWLRHYGFQCLEMPSLAGGLAR